MSKHRPHPGKSGPNRPQGPRPGGNRHQGASQAPQRGPQPPRDVQRDVQRDAQRGGEAPARARSGEVWIYGHHPVAAALANPDRKILRLVATAEAAAKLGEDANIPARTLGQLKTLGRRDIDNLVGEDAVHQGVAVLTHTLDYDLIGVLERIGEQGAAHVCIVVLDQVTDPHNVGAILRSAAAFGAAAVIAPDRHAPDETGTMAKSASGALDRIPYVKAGNLVRALEVIKEHQFWLVGLDADGSQKLDKVKLDGKIALVMGAEGEGLRRLVRETCDHIAALPMAGGMESLNVSNATAVALYERARQVSAK